MRSRLYRKFFSEAKLPVLTESEREMLEYYMFSTTYGTLSQGIRHTLEEDYGTIGKGAKIRYLLRRIFPKTEFYKTYSPVAYKYRILIPAVWFGRLLKGFFKRRRQIRQELDTVRRLDKK